MSFTSTLDLSKLLLLHASASAVTAIGVAPSYNLPIALYGLYVVDKGSSGELGTDALRSFTGMLGLSIALDVFWLIAWSGEPAGFAVFLILANLALKPVTLLACASNLRQRGEPTLPSFGGNGSNTVWSMPGGFTSSANANGGYADVAGNGDADADEFDVPTSPPKSKARPPAAAPPPPRGPAQGGGYHTLGDDES